MSELLGKAIFPKAPAAQRILIFFQGKKLYQVVVRGSAGVKKFYRIFEEISPH